MGLSTGASSTRLLGTGLAALPSQADMVEGACLRLRLASGAALVGLGVAVLVLPFVQPNVGGIRDGLARPFGVIPIGILASLAMSVVAGRSSLPAPRRLGFGLIWLVTMCALVSVFTHWLPYDDQLDLVRGPSGVAFAILVYATIVPTPTRQMVIAGLLAASMDPLGLLATFALGNPVPRPTFWLWLFVPTLAATGLGALASRTLFLMADHLGRAREMGAYRLVQKLGAGGMGEVWRAEHRHLARPAAIKLIRPDRMGGTAKEADTIRRRFAREAEATATLQSPHTIEVYDVGVAEDGSFYYVMELLDGSDLATLIQRDGAMPPARVVHLLMQACHSLDEAHARGMVHRDIKPANLYACRRGQELDFLKVLDFGIVKLRSGDEPTQLTADDVISGTPAYIAPETLTGGDIDGRADIYSLGCVAFHLLTGSLLFEGDTPLAMVFAHAQQPPRAPSALRDGIPADLDALVLRCLSKDPAARPPTCAALRELLARTGLAVTWDPTLAWPSEPAVAKTQGHQSLEETWDVAPPV